MSDASQVQPKFPALRELMRCRSVASRRAEKEARWVPVETKPAGLYAHLLRGVTMTGYGDSHDGRGAC